MVIVKQNKKKNCFKPQINVQSDNDWQIKPVCIWSVKFSLWLIIRDTAAATAHCH